MFNWTIFLSKKATIHKKFVHIYHKTKDEIYTQLPMEEVSFQNRSKDFCWMISNCGTTFSKTRYKIADALIASLSREVHIWGQALKLGCVKNQTNVVNHGGVKGGSTNYYDVAQKYIRDCKFYFAFENSNCSDYVTEKFLNAIEAGAIPIVIGWWDTYKELLPGSFIHVNEFANSSQLADYLASLLKDETKMNKYHEWRRFYRYERTGVMAACQLCQKLERFKIDRIAGRRSKPSIITNMAEKFKSLQKCAP